MHDYQQRVIEEKRELDGKRYRLRVFINSPRFLDLDDKSKFLLENQASVMEEYSLILGSRISHFES